MLILLPLACAGWFGMNNLITEAVTPGPGDLLSALAKISYLLSIYAVFGQFGVWTVYKSFPGSGKQLPSGGRRRGVRNERQPNRGTR